VLFSVGRRVEFDNCKSCVCACVWSTVIFIYHWAVVEFIENISDVVVWWCFAILSVNGAKCYMCFSYWGTSNIIPGPLPEAELYPWTALSLDPTGRLLFPKSPILDFLASRTRLRPWEDGESTKGGDELSCARWSESQVEWLGWGWWGWLQRHRGDAYRKEWSVVRNHHHRHHLYYTLKAE